MNSVNSELVIAIDGPAGAGKSTVAKAVAKILGLCYVDTGAMYRAFALKAQRQGVGIKDEADIKELCKDTHISLGNGDPVPVYLDNEEVSALIRTPEISELSSAFSVFPEVRQLLASEQKRIIENGDAVLEGRDTTTVIAPEAPIRIFLTATLEERAKRRTLELQSKGLDANIEDIKTQIAERDHRDASRKTSPLKHADGVHMVDSDGLSIDQVVDKILSLVKTWRSDSAAEKV